GEPPRRVGDEHHLGNRARFHLALDVVAVQVQDDRPVRRPSQFAGAALLTEGDSRAFRYATLLDLEVESDLAALRSRRDGAGCTQPNQLSNQIKGNGNGAHVA